MEKLDTEEFSKGLDLKSIDLKKAQFLCSLPKSLGVNPDNQKEITLTLELNNDISAPENNYEIPLQNSQYKYEVNLTEYNWFEINEIGNNLNLTDDSITEIDIGFNFNY